MRGTGSSRELTTPIFMSSDNQGLVALELQRSLRARSLLEEQFVDTAMEVLIDNEQRSRRVASVGSDTRVRDVELEYSLQLNTRFDPESEYTSQSMRVRREYIFDVNGVLGSSDQEEVLYEEMRRELVRRLQRRLATITQDAAS